MNYQVPSRNDIVWSNIDSTNKNSLSRPVLVLSSQLYNTKTGLMICCPISASSELDKTRVRVHLNESPMSVMASVVQTLDWKGRDIKIIKQAEEGVLTDVLSRLVPLLGAAELF